MGGDYSERFAGFTFSVFGGFFRRRRGWGSRVGIAGAALVFGGEVIVFRVIAGLGDREVGRVVYGFYSDSILLVVFRVIFVF